VELDDSATEPVLAAVAALLVTLLAAVLSKHHDRQQQARTVLLPPAELFAQAASAALARLRYVTPPSSGPGGGSSGHRNEPLLSEPEIRGRRLEVCRDAIDEVRSARARVRVVFHPGSAAAEYTRETLQQLRACLESAERYYVEHDLQSPADRQAWRTTRGVIVRRTCKSHRWSAYHALDQFYNDTASRLQSPTWKFSRMSKVSSPRFWTTTATLLYEPGPTMATAHVRARSGEQALEKLREVNLEGISLRSIQPSSRAIQDTLVDSPISSGLAVALQMQDQPDQVLWLPQPLVPGTQPPTSGRWLRHPWK
jgi:hypothetical protein